MERGYDTPASGGKFRSMIGTGVGITDRGNCWCLFDRGLPRLRLVTARRRRRRSTAIERPGDGCGSPCYECSDWLRDCRNTLQLDLGL